MYLQITTRCNMQCRHCCYSCSPHKGKHMNYNTFLDAVRFIGDYSDQVSIGGGEPTLHPRFFDILRQCLWAFDYVWMATNGKRTKTMWRLASILDGWDNVKDETDIVIADGKLTVALSTDYFHEAIDYDIRETWKSRGKNKVSGYELRDVTDSYKGVINAGRARRTHNGCCDDECVCTDIFIQPDGKVKLCGCRNAPIIGSIWSGIEEKWEDIRQNDEGYRSGLCYTKVGTEK